MSNLENTEKSNLVTSQGKVKGVSPKRSESTYDFDRDACRIKTA